MEHQFSNGVPCFSLSFGSTFFLKVSSSLVWIISFQIGFLGVPCLFIVHFYVRFSSQARSIHVWRLWFPRVSFGVFVFCLVVVVLVFRFSSQVKSILVCRISVPMVFLGILFLHNLIFIFRFLTK